ncbi:collagen alpha-5(VI) chain-like isoform X1 [Oculina patagonica]
MASWFIHCILFYSFCQVISGFIWERHDTGQHNYQDRFQKVPSRAVTARKIERFFLGQRGRHKRSTNHETPNYDVVFVFDASNSIRERDFYKGVKAMQHLIERAQENTHFAAITFSDKAAVAFNFTDRKTAKHNLHNKVRFIGDKTNTEQALKICRTELFRNKNSNLRLRAKKRVLLLADGSSNVNIHLTLYRAFELKILGVEMFVIGVGNYMPGIQELVGIASSTDRHLFRVRDVMSLLEIVRLIPDWKYVHQYQLPWVMDRISKSAKGTCHRQEN